MCFDFRVSPPERRYDRKASVNPHELERVGIREESRKKLKYDKAACKRVIAYNKMLPR